MKINKNKLRWLIVSMVFIATGLNFLDRQVLSVAIIKIQEEFNMSDVQYGFINTSFLISYGLMFTVAGRIIDHIGGKYGLAISVGVWSIANALHGLANNFYHLITFRFLLGMGEGGCFPGAAKSVYEWFDKKERALANGIAIGGAAIGAIIAPPMTTFLSNNYGWRWGFILPGLIGLVWVVIWLFFPKKNPELNVEEKSTTKIKPFPFKYLLKRVETWIFIIIRFMVDPVFYFMMFWVPKYLNEQRGVEFDQVGDIFWIPFLALGISNILGGWLSGILLKGNMSLDKARKLVMGLAAVLTMVLPLIEVIPSVLIGVLLMGVMMLAHGFWITNYITAISDMFGNRATSTVVGLSGTAGTVSSLLINPLIGVVVASYSYTPLWIVAGLVYPMAFILLVIFVPKIQPIEIEER